LGPLAESSRTVEPGRVIAEPLRPSPGGPRAARQRPGESRTRLAPSTGKVAVAVAVAVAVEVEVEVDVDVEVEVEVAVSVAVAVEVAVAVAVEVEVEVAPGSRRVGPTPYAPGARRAAAARVRKRRARHPRETSHTEACSCPGAGGKL
jgi:hypothetical protein